MKADNAVLDQEVKDLGTPDVARALLAGPATVAAERVLESGWLNLREDFWNIVQSLGWRRHEDDAETNVGELLHWAAKNGPVQSIAAALESDMNESFCDRTHVAYILGVAVGLKVAAARAAKPDGAR